MLFTCLKGCAIITTIALLKLNIIHHGKHRKPCFGMAGTELATLVTWFFCSGNTSIPACECIVLYYAVTLFPHRQKCLHYFSFSTNKTSLQKNRCSSEAKIFQIFESLPIFGFPEFFFKKPLKRKNNMLYYSTLSY